MLLFLHVPAFYTFKNFEQLFDLKKLFLFMYEYRDLTMDKYFIPVLKNSNVKKFFFALTNPILIQTLTLPKYLS